MLRPLTAALCAAAALTAVPLAGAATDPTPLPAARAAAITELEGRVLSVNRSARTFRLREHHRGVVRIRVTSSTRYERLSGFGALRRGMQVEVDARRADGRWTARTIERDRGTDDDSGGHGSDD